MASNEDPRVVRTRPDLLSTIEERFASALDKVLKDHRPTDSATFHLTEEQRHLLIARFKQSFHNKIYESVRIAADETSTSSNSAIKLTALANDQKSTDYYVSEVLPTLQTTVLEVASKRKTIPAQCSQLLGSQLKTRLSEAVALANPSSSSEVLPDIVTKNAADNALLDHAKTINGKMVELQRDKIEGNAKDENANQHT